MKIYLVVCLFGLLPAALFSRDITTLSGTTYKDAKVFDSNPVELIIAYQDTDKPELTIMRPVLFTDLPDDIRKEYKYDPVKAQAYDKARKEWEKKKEKQGESAEIIISPDKAAPLKKVVPADDNVLDGNTAPGERNGEDEVDSMRQEAMAQGLAPGELEGAAEGRKMKQEAMAHGLAPGELEGAAEGRKIKQEAMAQGLAPGEREGAAEGREIKREALQSGRAPGEKEY